MEREQSRLRIFGNYCYIILMTALAVVPFLWVVLTSLKPEAEIFDPGRFWPSLFYGKHYYEVWFNADFFRYFLNSAIVALTSTFICLLFSVMAAYGFTRFTIRGGNQILLAVLFTQMFPAVLLVLPYYILMKRLNLNNTLAGLVIVYTSFVLPFCIWNIKNFFAALPWELEEAAFVDGCNRFQAIVKAILPIAKPGIAATAILAFIRSWDEFMYANTFINTKELRTVQLGLQSFIGEYTTEWGKLMAGAVISCVPVMLFFGFIQQNLVQGLAAGSVKG